MPVFMDGKGVPPSLAAFLVVIRQAFKKKLRNISIQMHH